MTESHLSDLQTGRPGGSAPLQLPPPPPDPQDLPVLQLYVGPSQIHQSSPHPSPEWGSCHPLAQPNNHLGVPPWSQPAPNSPRDLPEHLPQTAIPGTWAITCKSF